MSDNEERYKRFRVKPYVIPDGRTPEQIERDERLLTEVRKLQAMRRTGDVDPRDRVFALTGFVTQREPIYTYEQALKGKADWDYLPNEACKVCGRMPFWNGFTYDDNHDRAKHGTREGIDALDSSIARINREQMTRIGEIVMPQRVRSDDDE